MLAELRREVQAALLQVETARKPALRRTTVPDALLATDLPLTAGEEAVARFAEALRAQGWTVRAADGWLQLDKPVPVPAADLTAPYPGECGCCLSLLQRHPGGAADALLIRRVVKAAEGGAQPFQRLCRQLHGELAEALRRHEVLPASIAPYLARAYLATCRLGG